MIKVLIADDHALLRQGIRALIDTTTDIQVIGEAANGFDAVEKARLLNPDVILMDLEMPRKDGLSAIEEIKQENPAIQILVLTSFDDDERVYSAIKCGALGYLLKDSTADELIRGIQEVYQGEPSLSPLLAIKVIREMKQPALQKSSISSLTDREIEVLDLVARGFSNQMIAEKLVITERTVGKHVSNILSKLNLANRTQAALYARQKGLCSSVVDER
jgi:NarL family two-component system response regulator LiaR